MLYYIVCTILRTGVSQRMNSRPMTAAECEAQLAKVSPSVKQHRTFVLEAV